jgi:CBS domain-containing protein
VEEAMPVAWIIKEKGRNVLSVLPSAALNEVVTILARNRIGAVVVVDDQHRVKGIVSERDIVRILATLGPGALIEPVSEHMTKPVMTCTEQHSIDWVMGEMTANRFRHMPIAEHGRLCGIISIGDVVKHKLAMAEAEAAHMRQYFVAG